MKNLTTTSYAILGLLTIQPWTAYGLAKQMERSLRFVWPRAESKLYEEPRNLVAHGYASAERGYDGRRPRTVYSITQQGREAFRRWLEEPGEGPVLEFEGLLKVLFADAGNRAALLRTIRHVQDEAEERLEVGAMLAREYLERRGPYPQRLHVNALVWTFLWEQAAAWLRWARWAEEEVVSWPDVSPSSDTLERALGTFRRVLEPEDRAREGREGSI